ncbi:hypothetical protein [Actinomyces minihominis]|uniref:hypothetical protein n=1 Tax=Actinomyces minihominis TaxID=2002838 RepID=UPI000C07E8B2|nr:hypothetical protein [Actinomyces minihominis]
MTPKRDAPSPSRLGGYSSRLFLRRIFLSVVALLLVVFAILALRAPCDCTTPLGAEPQSEARPEVKPGYAQTVITSGSNPVALGPGDKVEIWGPAPSCPEDSCPIDLLAANVTVLSVEEPMGELFADERRPLLTVSLPAGDIAGVLQASDSDRIHFVVR